MSVITTKPKKRSLLEELARNGRHLELDVEIRNTLTFYSLLGQLFHTPIQRPKIDYVRVFKIDSHANPTTSRKKKEAGRGCV